MKKKIPDRYKYLLHKTKAKVIKLLFVISVKLFISVKQAWHVFLVVDVTAATRPQKQSLFHRILIYINQSSRDRRNKIQETNSN